MSHSSTTQQPTAPPAFTFEIDDSLAEWKVPVQEWLTTHAPQLQAQNLHLDGIASGALVFNAANQLLLIQRASHDSMPNKWEVPGGAVDTDDATILHGAARELWEEAGLTAKRFGGLVTEGKGGRAMQVFENSKGTKRFCRFSFSVEVEVVEGENGGVRLDPNEHQDFVWADEDEVRAQRKGGREMPVTHEAVLALMLEGFRLRKG